MGPPRSEHRSGPPRSDIEVDPPPPRSEYGSGPSLPPPQKWIQKCPLPEVDPREVNMEVDPPPQREEEQLRSTAVQAGGMP